MLHRTINVEQHDRLAHIAAMDMNKTVLEAIALRKCLEATYNRVRIRLAPHILYTKHDQLYLDAVTVERDGKPPREIKVGAFKLDGLNDIALTDRQFEPQRVFNPQDAKYQGSTLFAVEAA